MRLRYILPAGLILLGACATVLDERRTTAVISEGFFRGEPYDVVTQTVQGRSGTFERTRVVYRGRTATCIIDSGRDCEFAARRLMDWEVTGSGF